MMWRLLAAVAVPTLIITSCSPKTAGVALDTDAISPHELVSRVQENSSKLTTLAGNGTLSFESRTASGTGWFSAVLKRPDSLLVQVEGPFGIDVGTLFLSKESYLVYNSLENHVVTGIPSSQSIRAVVPFDLTHEQILSAFAGMFTGPPRGGSPLEFTVDEDEFLLSYQCGDDVCQYWINPEYLLVARVRRKNLENDVLMDAQCELFVEEDGVTAPKRITIKFPRDNREILIAYSSLHLNVAEPSFAFSIPDNARKTIR